MQKNKDVSNDGPILLVGQFFVDLYRHTDIPENCGFTLLKYDPTMYRMTHPYFKKPIYVCRDFLLLKTIMANQQLKFRRTLSVLIQLFHLKV